VTLSPPFVAGGEKVIAAAPARVAFTTKERGAEGTVKTLRAFEADEAGPAPARLVALTVKVYRVPGVSPVTVPVVRAVLRPVHRVQAGCGVTA